MSRMVERIDGLEGKVGEWLEVNGKLLVASDALAFLKKYNRATPIEEVDALGDGLDGGVNPDDDDLV